MKNITKISLLVFCMIGELFLQTNYRGIYGITSSPLYHFIFSLCVGLVLLSFSKKTVSSDKSFSIPAFKREKTAVTPVGYLRIAMVVLLMIKISFSLRHLFTEHPIDMLDPLQTGSDIIPQVMFFVTRAISGVYPYQPITAPLWGYTLTPTYLPFQWIPYIPAQLLHFDYRWIPFTVLSLTLILFLVRSEKTVLPALSKWGITAATIILLIYHYKFNLEDCINTVEPLVAAYYLLFALSLLSNKPWLIASTIVLCLLSRYSMVLWLPLLFLIYFSNNGLKITFQLGLLVIAGIALFYGPFLWKDPHIFSKGYEYYTKATLAEWQIQDWQAVGSNPFHLERGLGFAIYFYKNFSRSIGDGIYYLRITHLTLCLSVVAILGIYYWLKKHNIHQAVFAIASLKIYLTFFYGFIQIPYSYLYFLPLLVDLAVLYIALSVYQQKSTIKNANFVQLI